MVGNDRAVVEGKTLEGCSADLCVKYFRTFFHALVSCDASSVLSSHSFVTTVRFAFTFGNVLRPSCGFICDPVYPHRNTFRFCRFFFLLVHFIHEFVRSLVLRQPLGDGNGVSGVFERLPGLPDEIRTSVTSQGSIVRELDEKEVVFCGSRVNSTLFRWHYMSVASFTHMNWTFPASNQTPRDLLSSKKTTKA